MDEEHIVKLLLTDYENHSAGLRHVSDSVIARVNTYITVVSAVLGCHGRIIRPF